MIRSLRAFFLGRLLREKLLLLGFLAIGVIMWGSSFWTRATKFQRSVHTTTQELKDQDFWLSRRDQIQKATEQAAAQMDPNRTLDPTGLSVAVSQLASDAGIQGNLRTLNSEAALSSGQFSINRLRLQLTNTNWHSFAVFYQHLQERAPYVAITEMSLQPVRGNPAQVTAVLTVASFEIRH